MCFQLLEYVKVEISFQARSPSHFSSAPPEKQAKTKRQAGRQYNPLVWSACRQHLASPPYEHARAQPIRDLLKTTKKSRDSFKCRHITRVYNPPVLRLGRNTILRCVSLKIWQPWRRPTAIQFPFPSPSPPFLHYESPAAAHKQTRTRSCGGRPVSGCAVTTAHAP